jgi:hypothetical protein
MRWFRLHADAVDDEKLRLLAFEDRWHFVAILCCKSTGIIDCEDMVLLRRKVAVKLGLDARELDEVARRLSEVGLIDSQSLQPVAWSKRQFESDSSTERTRKWRQKQHETSRERHCDVTVTPPDTDTDTESLVTSNEVTCARRGAEALDCPHSEVLKAWAEELPTLPQHDPALWRGARQAMLRQRWKETATAKGWRSKDEGLAYFRKLFRYIGSSPFLTGQTGSNGRRPFVAELEWVIRPANWAKIIEGKYHA